MFSKPYRFESLKKNKTWKKMINGMPMNGLRRNDDAMKN